MMHFLTENMGTIFTGLVLLGIVAAIIRKIQRDRKKDACAGCSCCCERRMCRYQN